MCLCKRFKTVIIFHNIEKLKCCFHSIQGIRVQRGKPQNNGFIRFYTDFSKGQKKKGNCWCLYSYLTLVVHHNFKRAFQVSFVSPCPFPTDQELLFCCKNIRFYNKLMFKLRLSQFGQFIVSIILSIK